ncbi:ankyrin repeat domain-containing protein [Candidatus Odyssella thessalonicensis]|uniref:ankyrin repeat domain-containing protein n=1 Tax=Candidatus Odyssella thessalonicensis TaxID=84647 RepID=UPI000225AEE4|nr:ankyrin repeat domain-containing protein [Candidatus Odyssella thessalonicensis]
MRQKLRTLSLYFMGALAGSCQQIDEAQIGDLYNRFSPGSQHLSPVNGLLALRSTLIDNIRFQGKYGPYNQSYLCHYQITNPPAGIEPSTDRDCPQDATTAVIQQLFPSAAGGRLVLPTRKHDFFNALPLTKIGELLELYTQLKQDKTSQDEAYNSLKRLFRAWILSSQSKNSSQSFLNSHKRNELKKLWASQFDNLEALADSYAAIFAGSLQEAQDYPHHIIESALLAFVCKKSATAADLEPLLQALGRHLVPSPFKTEEYSQAWYTQWKHSAVHNNTVQLEGFLALAHNPENLIFTTLAYDKYENPYPKMLGTGQANHTYLDPVTGTVVKATFSDCGEAALRNFLNIMLADPKTQSFRIDHLKAVFPHASSKLVQFYEGNPHAFHAYSQLHYTDIIGHAIDRSAWADVVSSLNEAEDTLKVRYADAGGRCNLRPGIDNIFVVLAKLLNDDQLTAMIAHPPKEARKNRADMMSYILNKLSRRDEVYFSWHVKYQRESIENIADLTLQINHRDQYIWQFLPQHFEFNSIEKSSLNKDWRRNSLEPLQQLITQYKETNPSLLGQLLNFYLNRPQVKKILKDLALKTEMQPFLLEIFYTSSLQGLDQKLKALDLGFTLSPAHPLFQQVARKWLNEVPDDAANNQALVVFIDRHKASFGDDVFTHESYPRLKDLYEKTLQELNANPNNLFNYMNYFSQDLILSSLENKTAEEIASIKNRRGETLLTVACTKGLAKLVKGLLHRAGEALLVHVNPSEGRDNPLHMSSVLKNPKLLTAFLKHRAAREILFNQQNLKEYGKTSLHIAAEVGADEAIKLLLNIEEVRKILLSPENIKTDMAKTPLHWAAEKGHAAIVKLLLEDVEVCRLFLDPENIREWQSRTPLESAIQAGHAQVVQALLQHPQARTIFLSEENIKDKYGASLLHHAAHYGNTEVIQVLLADDEVKELLFNDKNFKDADGDTPIDYATRARNPQVIELLREAHQSLEKQ